MGDRIVTIYKITNMEIGKCYVGATIGPILKRLRGHWNHANAHRRPYLLQKAMREYGFEAFCIEVLAEACCQHEAIAIERAMIAVHNTLAPNGYNLSTGGEKSLGRLVSQETRKALSEYRTGLKWSDESRAKASASHKGKKWSIAKRAKMEAIQSSDDYRAKMRANHAKRGPVVHTEESRAKLRAATLRQFSNPEKRKEHSEIIKAKYRDDSEYREKCELAHKNLSPEERQRRADLMRQNHGDSEFVKKMREGKARAPKRIMTEEEKKLRSVISKKMWADPKMRERISKATKDGAQKAWDKDKLAGGLRRKKIGTAARERHAREFLERKFFDQYNLFAGPP